MITTKIQALFQFIDYLYSNIDNFNKYNDLINEILLLDKIRQKASSKSTYKEKFEYDNVQAEIEKKFKKLQDNTANPIKAKAKALNVCDFDKEPEYNFNEVESEIYRLKENFSKEDLPEIFKHKSHYIEYRSKTHKTFLSLQFFFDDLDEIAKVLFDFFKDTEHNEFEGFATKTIPVNNISEAINLLQMGHTKFILPNDFLSHDKEKSSEDKNNTVFNFTEAYNKEVTKEKIEKLKIEVSKIKDIEQKILFLENEQIEYLQSLPPEIIEVSGTTFFPNFHSGEPLFFDRIIQLEIDKYKKQIKSKQAKAKNDKFKNKLDNIEYIVCDNNESAEIIFEKIKNLEIISQVEVAVSHDNPKRTELFLKICEAVKDETVKKNISLIVQRIEKAVFPSSEFSQSEIEYYQSLFAFHFYKILSTEDYQTHIEDKIRELLNYCEGLKLDLELKKYEFIEDRENDKSEYFKANRYKHYLENLLINLNIPTPVKDKMTKETNNDFVSIKLGEYKDKFNNENDYNKAVSIIHEYFIEGKATCKSPIFIRNGNIKNIAYAMGEIWRSQRNGVITYEYLLFYTKLFTIFKNYKVEKGNIFGNKLYKYSISKT